MLPVSTVAESRAADEAAPAPHELLVRRAGTALAAAAAEVLGGAYGKRVVVVAGKGSNGADGRAAASLLRRRGAKVDIVDAAAPPPALPPGDLVIDAAYGTGFRGRYLAPDAGGSPVLAADIPSGVVGDSGEASGRPLPALRTVTFGSLKPGLLQWDGRGLAGRVTVADIGVEPGATGARLVEDADVPALLPRRPVTTHKWASAVVVVAGSSGMEGAAVLAASGAARAGAGMVRLAVPGSPGPAPWPVEAVRLALPESRWADEVLEAAERTCALVIGPGLGRDETTSAEVRRIVDRSPVPVVADADALFALAGAGRISSRNRSLVLTPHDGEYARFTSAPPGPDRIAAARRLASETGATVLLKGSLTAVAEPDGTVLLSAAGSARLATAGTGDVLSGVIGAFLARGLPTGLAAGLAAHVHGRAAGLGSGEGLVAPDLPRLVSTWLAATVGDGRG